MSHVSQGSIPWPRELIKQKKNYFIVAKQTLILQKKTYKITYGKVIKKKYFWQFSSAITNQTEFRLVHGQIKNVSTIKFRSIWK